MIIKVRPNREQIRGLLPRELVERAERQQVTVSRQKKSAALATGVAFIIARKVNNATGVELLRKYTG